MDQLRELIGASPAIEALRANIRRLVQTGGAAVRPPAVLITGETGTGKGLVARLLHRVGPRVGGPFVDVNCAAIPDALLESELFGYERGAFTEARQAKPGLFQTAHGGALFLDEIGLLSEVLQAKLLKVLEDRTVRRLGATRSEPVDAWIMSATNADLATEMREGRFREDVYHRLSVVTLALPALRERDGDVIILAEHFLARACREYGRPARTLAPDARRRLLDHPWPGNVRELANVMERSALMADSAYVDAQSLDLDGSPSGPATLAPSPPTVAPPADAGHPGRSLDEVMRDHVQVVLDQHGGNISRAAIALGISRNTLRAHVQKFDLTIDSSRRTRSAAPPRTRAGAPPDRERPDGGSSPPADVTPVPPAAGDEGRATERLAGGRSASAAREATAAKALRWDRRLVTVMAVALGQSESTEPFSLAPLLQQLLATVQAFGGRVEELTPSGMVTAFGADAGEDGPRRAAYAALATRTALGRDPRDRPVEGRWAIHIARSLVATGREVVQIDARDRRAARDVLEALLTGAAPGTIAVSPATAPHLERRFELAPGGGRAADEGLSLVGPERSGFEVGGSPLSRFVGRDRDLAMLQDRLARAEEGHGQVIGILGEPGVGKSRLLREFRLGLGRERATFLTGRCLPNASAVPYLPIVDLVRNAFGIAETDSVDTVADKLHAGLHDLDMTSASAAPLLLHLLGYRRGTESLVGQSPEAIRTRTLDLLRQLMLLVGRRRPIVCTLEDLQWADQSSEDVLATLVDSVPSSRVLLLATYRQGYHPPWLGKSYASQLALDRLTQEESLAVLESVLPAGPLPSPTVQRIIARAEGVPLFIEELARAVVEGVADTPDGSVPDTIEGVLAARLDRLGEGDRELLQVASVIGRSVSVAILEAVSHQPEADLLTALARLRSGEFLYEMPSAFGSMVTFKHALTHEVTYRSLPEARRRRLHGDVAAAIGRLAPETAERRPEVLAYHYTQAGQAHEAIGYWHQAGQRAIQGSANAEAVAHLTTGLSLLETLAGIRRTQQELGLRLSLITALGATRSYGAPEVEESLARVRALVDELGDAPELTPVRFGLFRFYLSQAEIVTALEFAAHVLAAGERQGDDGLRSAGHVAVGVCRFYLGEYVRATAHIERSLALFRPSHGAHQLVAYGQHLGVGARGYLAWFATVMGQFDRGAEEASRAIIMAREVGHQFTLALALGTVGMVDGERGDAERLAQRGEELLSVSREQGFQFFIAIGLYFTGWAALLTGDRLRAVALMREGADVYRAAHQRVGLRLRAQLAEGLLEIGEVDEALRIIDEGLTQADHAREGAAVPELYRVRGRALDLRIPGDPAAEASLQQALALARAQGAWLHALRAATELVRLGRRRGGPSAGEASLREVYERFTDGFDLPDLRAAHALLEPGPASSPD
jgi:DNA-binding NtrC family response regulator/tetratricopeptide (TPR) repeat protein